MHCGSRVRGPGHGGRGSRHWRGHPEGPLAGSGCQGRGPGQHCRPSWDHGQPPPTAGHSRGLPGAVQHLEPQVPLGPDPGAVAGWGGHPRRVSPPPAYSSLGPTPSHEILEPGVAPSQSRLPPEGEGVPSGASARPPDGPGAGRGDSGHPHVERRREATVGLDPHHEGSLPQAGASNAPLPGASAGPDYHDPHERVGGLKGQYPY